MTTSMRLAPVLLAAAAAIAVSACRDRGADAPPAATATVTGHRYDVRGEIVRLPAAGAPAPELSIRHEAIPDFKDKSGAPVGMSSMVMPFPVAKDVSLAGLEPGDKIRFTFLMDWERNAFVIESLEELPRETALELGGGTR
jgi:Cu/Ag efflux protein CusF